MPIPFLSQESPNLVIVDWCLLLLLLLLNALQYNRMSEELETMFNSFTRGVDHAQASSKCCDCFKMFLTLPPICSIRLNNNNMCHRSETMSDKLKASTNFSKISRR